MKYININQYKKYNINNRIFLILNYILYFILILKSDLIHVVSGLAVPPISDPYRFQKAQGVVDIKPMCTKCNTACWSKLESVYCWIGHNQFLRAVVAEDIAPPELPPTFSSHDFGLTEGNFFKKIDHFLYLLYNIYNMCKNDLIQQNDFFFRGSICGHAI